MPIISAYTDKWNPTNFFLTEEIRNTINSNNLFPKRWVILDEYVLCVYMTCICVCVLSYVYIDRNKYKRKYNEMKFLYEKQNTNK
jgi:hypothetical protein